MITSVAARMRVKRGANNNMESRYSIQPADNLVRLWVRGVLTVEGLIKLMDRIAAEKDFRPGMNAIGDFRECQGSWDYSEIQRFRDHLVHATHNHECRWAAVVGSGAIAAVAHVAIVISEALGARAHMRSFDDPESALRWINGELEL